MVSSEPASRNREVHHHHRYVGYNGHFAACRIVRDIPVLIMGGSGSHRIFSHGGLLNNVVHTYRGHRISVSALRHTISSVRTGLRGSLSHRISSVRVNRLTVRGLGSVSRITCIEFTSICERFGSVGTFVSRLSRLLEGEWSLCSTRALCVKPLLYYSISGLDQGGVLCGRVVGVYEGRKVILEGTLDVIFTVILAVPFLSLLSKTVARGALCTSVPMR